MLNVPRVLADSRTAWFDAYLGASKEDTAALDAAALASAAFREFSNTPRAILAPEDVQTVERAAQRFEGRLMDALAVLRRTEAYRQLTPARRTQIERDVMRTG